MKIGLEIHLQLPTKSKLFCTCSTIASYPNSEVCPICLGFPGSRPALNARALEMGALIARFLKCEINETIWFSRKTYFYPDLPKDFQITQYESPLGTNGEFYVGGRRIGIWRAHLEEDPGRIRRVGRAGEEVSLIDYNRSGIPLVEIVTAPDIESPSEARDFLTDLLIELRHLVGITEQDEQTVRVDANISIGEERVEIKNITGLKNLERGLKFEASRQSKLLNAGKTIVRETRRYDEERGVTLPSREKEVEEDYGYIGEPDLGVFNIAAMSIGMETIETPLVRADRLCRLHSIDRQTARQIILTSWKLADLFEYLCLSSPAEKVIPWLLGPISSNWEDLLRSMNHETKEELSWIIAGVAEGKMTDGEGRQRIEALALGTEFQPAELKSEEELDSLIASLVDEHPQVVQDYKSNEKAANFIIGQLMKATKGRYQSREVVERVKKELERRIKES